MRESVMDVAKVHDDDFLQRMNCKIETQAGTSSSIWNGDNKT